MFLSYHSVNQSCIFFLFLAINLYGVLNELLCYLTATVHISSSENALFLLVLHASFILLLNYMNCQVYFYTIKSDERQWPVFFFKWGPSCWSTVLWSIRNSPRKLILGIGLSCFTELTNRRDLTPRFLGTAAQITAICHMPLQNQSWKQRHMFCTQIDYCVTSSWMSIGCCLLINSFFPASSFV